MNEVKTIHVEIPKKDFKTLAKEKIELETDWVGFLCWVAKMIREGKIGEKDEEM